MHFSKKLNFSKQTKFVGHIELVFDVKISSRKINTNFVLTIAYFYNFIRVRKHSYSLKKISL